MDRKLTHGSLFSGIGGFDLAAEWMGWTNVFHCEINEFCTRILNHHFPNAEHYADITKTDFTPWRGRIDVLSGGFPCQPFSLAGQRKGADDDRYLWPQMLRAIREIQPSWVVGENVAGILTMVQPGEEVEVGSEASLFGEADRKRTLLRQEYVAETVCRDLEREGYSVRPFVIPACAVGAPHRRDRVWFIARRIATDTCCNGGQAETKWKSGTAKENNEQPQPLFHPGTPADRTDTGAENMQWTGEDGIHAIGVVANAYSELSQCRNDKRQERRYSPDIGTEPFGSPSNWEKFPTQSPVRSGDDGISGRLDGITFPKWRQESIKAYGNAVAPQVVYEIFKAIQETYEYTPDK